MGRRLKHCKRGSGKSADKTNNNSVHALPSEGIVTTDPVPSQGTNTTAPAEWEQEAPAPKRPKLTRSVEAQLHRKGKKFSKQIACLEQAAAAANRSDSAEQHSAAGEAAFYAVDLESSASGDLPDQGEEWAEFSAGGSPAAEDPYQ